MFGKKTVKMLFLGAALALAMCFGSMASDSGLTAGIVTASSSLNFRASPSTSASVIAKLSGGSKIAVLSDEGAWYKAAVSGQTGYVSSAYVKKTDSADFSVGDGVISGSTVNLRRDASTNSSVSTQLSRGTLVTVSGVKNGWFKVSYKSYSGYIHSDYLEITRSTETSSRSLSSGASSEASESVPEYTGDLSSLRTDLLDYAKTLLGIKYVSGGKSPAKGFDCSGFTSYVFKKFGYSLSASSAGQAGNGAAIKKADLVPGDLVFFANPRVSTTRIGHVGIYIGDNTFIHASSPGDVVKTDSMTSSYYSKYYICSRRIIKDQ